MHEEVSELEDLQKWCRLHRLCSRDRQSVGEAGGPKTPSSTTQPATCCAKLLRTRQTREAPPKVVEVVQMFAKISRIKEQAVSQQERAAGVLVGGGRGTKRCFEAAGYRGHYMENGTIHYMLYNGPNGWRRLANSLLHEEQEALRKEKERTKAEREAERNRKKRAKAERKAEREAVRQRQAYAPTREEAKTRYMLKRKRLNARWSELASAKREAAETAFETHIPSGIRAKLWRV